MFSLPFPHELEILIKQYKPFNDSYINERFLNSHIQLFPDKLENLHGYKLKARVCPCAKAWHRGKGKEVDIEKIEVVDSHFLLIAAIQKKINFSLRSRKTILADPYIRKPNYVAITYLHNNSIDFIMNFNLIDGPIPSNITTSHLTHHIDYANQLLIRQSGYYEMEISWNLFLMRLVFILIVVVFTVLMALFKHNSKIWTVYNITLVLAGMSGVAEPPTRVDKLLYMLLILTSFTFSAILQDQLIDVILRKKNIL